MKTHNLASLCLTLNAVLAYLGVLIMALAALVVLVPAAVILIIWLGTATIIDAISYILSSLKDGK